MGIVTKKHKVSIARVVAIGLCLTVSGASMAAVDCSNWNSEEFFKEATVEEVAVCLKSGLDVQARDDEHGGTPLHWASALSEDSVIIATLLDAGADPNARAKNGVQKPSDHRRYMVCGLVQKIDHHGASRTNGCAP